MNWIDFWSVYWLIDEILGIAAIAAAGVYFLAYALIIRFKK